MRNMMFGVVLGMIAGLIVGPLASNIQQLATSTALQSPLPSLEEIAGASGAPTFVVSRIECEESAVITANRAWMEACYLSGELTGQCKDRFYPDGNYYYYFAVPPTGSARSVYERDEKTCACALPASLAGYLNEQQSDSYSACSDFPKSASSLE